MIAMVKKNKFGLHKIMTIPAIVLFVVFFVMPISQGFMFAFTDWNGFNKFKFIGFENFIRVFSDDRSVGAIKNTLIYGVSGTVLLNFFGFIYAIILDSKIKVKGLLRTLVYLPSIVSPLIMGYIWLLILSSENGVLFIILQTFNLEGLYIDFLSDPKAALFAIIFVNLWQFIGGAMIIYTAGLQSIAVELHESGIIDGANYFQELFYIKIPLLAPSIKINIITSIIGAMSIFDVIVALTGGGPGYYTESLSLYIYRATAASRAGYSTAVSLIMFIIIIIPVTIAFKALQKLDKRVN